MGKISISYRRGDSAAIAGRIFDRLVTYYGTEAVFRDIDNIPPGVDFRRYIGDALATTDVLLAIVGPQWLGKAEGRTRIEETTDLVRIEIEAALKKDIPVVPVLVGGANMPDPGELPDGLKDFAFRNAVRVEALEDFDDHIRRLIRSLDRLLDARQPPAAPTPPPQPREAARPDQRAASDEARPSAPEQAAYKAQVSKQEAQRSVADRAVAAPPKEDLVAGGPTAATISPLLVMPVLVIVLYGLLYLTGASTLGQASGYAPALPLAQAALLVVCVAWYGRVGIGPALIGGAVLWLVASALTLASSFLTAMVIANSPTSARVAFSLVIGLVNAVAIAAAIMAIGSRLCPALRQEHYWIVALLAYPLFSLAIGYVTPMLAAAAPSPDRETIAAAFFAAFVVRQVVIFTCLGLWVSQPLPDALGRPL